MTTDSSKIQNWTQFVVIESIPDGQPHTGKKIFEDLQTHCAYHGFTLSLKYMAVRSKDELCTALDAVEIDARLNGHRPILHIECHGSDDEKGLVLSDDSFVGWEELKPILTAINFHSGFRIYP